MKYNWQWFISLTILSVSRCTQSYALNSTCLVPKCKISGSSLDSAIRTFLCLQDDPSTMTEAEKKTHLSTTISPYLKFSGKNNDRIQEMDSAQLVPLVNLVLNGVANRLSQQTEEEYLDALIKEVSMQTRTTEQFYSNVNPILLLEIKCGENYRHGRFVLDIGKVVDGSITLLGEETILGSRETCNVKRFGYCSGQIQAALSSCAESSGQAKNPLKKISGYQCFSAWDAELYNMCRSCFQKACVQALEGKGQDTSDCDQFDNDRDEQSPLDGVVNALNNVLNSK